MTDAYSTVLDDLCKSEMTIYRWNMVQYAMAHGVSAAATYYNTTRDTVRKWVDRWRQGGRAALVDGRRGPNRQASQTPIEVEQQIIEFRKKHPQMGAERIKIELKLSISMKTIHRIILDAGLVIERKTRYRKRRDLRAIKQGLYDPGDNWQNDVMYLTDIPSAVEIIEKYEDAPKYTYNMRDVHSGAVFTGYARELSEKHAERFMDYMLRHFRAYGLTPENMIIQTDNGSEFSGARYKLWDRCGYSHTIHIVHGAEHRFIPPGCSNANGDIESYHSLIQREFFNLSRFGSLVDMLEAMAAYQLYFNTTRYCLSKGGRTPMQILEPVMGPAALQFLSLPPLNLDDLVYRPLADDELPTMADFLIVTPVGRLSWSCYSLWPTKANDGWSYASTYHYDPGRGRRRLFCGGHCQTDPSGCSRNHP